jgi:hypothetical protein
LRDTLTEWLERARKAPASAGRHPKETDAKRVRSVR